MSGYRDDDQTVGYCPKCGSRLTTLNIDANGYCGLHGWVPAEWDRPLTAGETLHPTVRRRWAKP